LLVLEETFFKDLLIFLHLGSIVAPPQYHLNKSEYLLPNENSHKIWFNSIYKFWRRKLKCKKFMNDRLWIPSDGKISEPFAR
jgi:hypothetical protein